MGLLKIISKSLQPDNAVSNMRLAATMIVTTGCIAMLSATTIFGISAYLGKVSITDMIAFGTVITSFTGIGIWGKVAQKKTEVEPQDTQNNG